MTYASDFDTEASGSADTVSVTVRVFRGEDFVQYIAIGGIHGGAAERTRHIRQEPRANARRMESVTTKRQQSELVLRLKLG